MKRRYKALIAIIIPIVLIIVLKFTHDASYQWVMGYMFAVALVFKTSIVSLWLSAQLHFLSFLAGLTLFQGFVLLVKRWLLDSVLATWIQIHIVDNVIDSFTEAKNYYMRQDFKNKFKNIFIFIFGISFSGWMLYIVGFLDNLLLFAELRLFIAGVFAAIVAFFTKIISWVLSLLAIAWLAPILEVFAFSFLLIRFEKWFGSDNVFSRFFNYLGEKINLFLYTLGLLKEKHIDKTILEPVALKSKHFGSRLSSKIRQKKIEEEYRYFASLENIIMKGHIDAYCSFKDMHECKDKSILYNRMNKKMSNNIHIVAYVSRDNIGTLLGKHIPSDFYNDVFILESFASHTEHGVKTYEKENDAQYITYHDFWVLNTSDFPMTIKSNTQNFDATRVEGNDLKLIKTFQPFCYENGDVFCEYNNTRVSVTSIPIA